MNEFEKAKQEIIELAQSIRMYSGLSKDVLIASIKQLQPPAPPTCSSCKYFGEWIKNSKNNCRRLHIFVDTTFGCNRHSDYEQPRSVQEVNE